MRYLLLTILCTLCTSCYRMPEEGEISTVPNTNNPEYSGKKKNTGIMPGFDY